MNKKITNVGGACSSSGKSSSDKSFSRVPDSNNQPIRGLWRQDGGDRKLQKIIFVAPKSSPC
ncbi:MAG: hypothetical protein VYE44_00815, partial [Verrucomicrobiota bacterium]|nr:hypothetical protein [Verrucomicrobiota bacterium]